MKNFVDYDFIDTQLVYSTVKVGEMITPVWRQNRWDCGQYQEFIRNNGCGHCCVAMVLNLHDIKITPHDEFSECIKLWGMPNAEQEYPQRAYLSISGIYKILSHYGVKAEYFGVKSKDKAKEQIDNALKSNKQVIFWSNPNQNDLENPFSTGEHYVLAVGYTKDAKILVANSSEKASKTGIQLVEINTIVNSLLVGADPQDLTWGESGPRERCAGFVVVG